MRFHRLPSAHNFTAWRRQRAPGFVFSVKAGGFVTRMKKLAGNGARSPRQ
ncbi:DUF72 domain-containing protein [Thauera sp. 2A1]|nr:DUF72 domain-containing protein [Pseudomonadota bacterium]